METPFWQGSTDHRGIPGAPGRVVTLVKDSDAVCWGTAYLVDAKDRDDVLIKLNYREKDGYSIHNVSVSFPCSEECSEPGLIYIANPEIPNGLGRHPLQKLPRRFVLAQVRLARTENTSSTSRVHCGGWERAIRTYLKLRVC